MSPTDKAELVKRLGRMLGFCRVGIASARSIERLEYLEHWLATGRAGQMGYLHRNHELRCDPGRLLDGARTVIVGAIPYYQPLQGSDGKGHSERGRVAMYAWGDDYHVIVKKRLHAWMDELRDQLDEPFDARACVDTVPILERELAARAGVGWIGKNTMVLHQDVGSYFFLGEIVTTLEVAVDRPSTDHCGSCTRCLDACPTDAFPRPYEMDASKCISYLTIEHRSDIPPEREKQMGDWVFGCDVCQQVCPYNRSPTAGDAFPVRSPGPSPVLDEMLKWTEEDYRRELRGSAMKRATLAMLKRNAAIAKHNAADH